MTNTVAIKPMGATTKAPQIIAPNQQQAMVKVWNDSLTKLTQEQNFKLTPTERNFATSTLYGIVDKCTKDKIDVNQLNTTNFLEQIKHFSKMQVSLQNKEFYIDIRNNSSTGMKDITLSLQYQGIQKLMTRYSTKKIVRFVDGIVCKGDTFKTTTDFNTGLMKIVAHEKNQNIDRSQLQNIEKAYAIAYVNELGSIVPYVKIIEKKRIMTAYNCSPSRDKTVWNAHTERMVIKTAYWCLYNDIIKPFIEVPSDLQESFAQVQDDMDFNQETQVDNQVYDIPTEEQPVEEETVSEEEPEKEEEAEEQPQQQEVAQDFIDYLDEQDKAQEIEVYYAEYLNHKGKYNLVRGTYDANTKKCKVTLK